MTEKVKRPHRTTMEGMIWNANHVLQDALRPGIRGVPKAFFMECAGIAVLSVVDVGCVFSGTVGTGILMAHMDDGSWSSPVACGLTGVGFGLLLGVAAKEIIVFFPDAMSIKTFFGTGVQLSGKTDITIGIGREFNSAVGWSRKGLSAVVSFAYSKGAFACVALETAVVAPRKAVNTHFYGKNVDDLMDIIQNKVKFPADKHTLLPDVHQKLNKLAAGISETPEEAEAAKLEAARLAADQAADDFHKTEEEEIVEVDAEKEAANDPVSELDMKSVSIFYLSETSSDTPGVSESFKEGEAAEAAPAVAVAAVAVAAVAAAEAAEPVTAAEAAEPAAAPEAAPAVAVVAVAAAEAAEPAAAAEAAEPAAAPEAAPAVAVADVAAAEAAEPVKAAEAAEPAAAPEAAPAVAVAHIATAEVPEPAAAAATEAARAAEAAEPAAAAASEAAPAAVEAAEPAAAAATEAAPAVPVAAEAVVAAVEAAEPVVAAATEGASAAVEAAEPAAAAATEAAPAAVETAEPVVAAAKGAAPAAVEAAEPAVAAATESVSRD